VVSFSVFERCSRFSTNIQFHRFDYAAYLYNSIGGKSAALDHLGAFEQCGSIAQRLFGCGICPVFADIGKFEQYRAIASTLS